MAVYRYVHLLKAGDSFRDSDGTIRTVKQDAVLDRATGEVTLHVVGIPEPRIYERFDELRVHRLLKRFAS